MSVIDDITTRVCFENCNQLHAGAFGRWVNHDQSVPEKFCLPYSSKSESSSHDERSPRMSKEGRKKREVKWPTWPKKKVATIFRSGARARSMGNRKWAGASSARSPLSPENFREALGAIAKEGERKKKKSLLTLTFLTSKKMYLRQHSVLDWSPTSILSGPCDACLRGSDETRKVHRGMAADGNLFPFQLYIPPILILISLDFNSKLCQCAPPKRRAHLVPPSPHPKMGQKVKCAPLDRASLLHCQKF